MTERNGILVVDDTPSALKLLTDILLAEGYQVRPANSGELALASVAGNPPELVLLDVRMPGIDGYEVCRRLKADPATRDIPVIFITAATALEDRVEGFSLGAVDFISKPYQRDELLARVRTHLELDRLRSRLENQVSERTAELARSEEKYRRLVDTLMEGILAIDEDANTTFVNPRLAEILGYSINEMIGKPMSSFMDQKEWEAMGPRLERRRQGIKEKYECEFIRKDGTKMTAGMSATPIYDLSGNFAGSTAAVSDITERKRAELELLESEERFRKLSEATFEGIVIHESGRALEINQVFSEMFGYPPSELIGRNVLEFLLTSESRKMVNEFIRLGREEPYEATGLRKSGESFVMEVRAKPLFYRGRIVRVAAVRDITERKSAEEERQQLLAQLENERERLEQVLRQMPAGVVIAEAPSGRLILGNEQAERIFQLPVTLSASMEEYGEWKVFHPDGRRLAPEEHPLARAVATGESVAGEELRILRGDGTGAVIYANAAPIRDRGGRIVAAVAAFMDITLRKQIEEERDRLLALLRESNQQLVLASTLAKDQAEVAQQRATELQSVLDNMVDGVFVCNPDGRIILANEAGVRLLGMADFEDVKQTLGEFPERLKLRHPDGRPIAYEELPLRRALAGEAIVHEDEVFFNQQSQRNVIIRSNAAPIRNEKGETVGAVEVARDVTELFELDRLKDQFIVVAAHELKTPVTGVKGYAQLLLQQEHEGITPRGLKALQAINRQADRISRLVNDLLEISQLQLGQLELAIERIDLPALVQEVMDRMALTTSKHRIEMVAAEPVVIQGDRGRIEEVVTNLLDNAIKYSPKGGDIEVTVTKDENDAIVSFHDFGVGIPADKQPRIFQRFYRAHTGTPFDYGGMGVGLYISREIVTRHGGRMWFESEEEKGSTFYFSLPLNSALALTTPGNNPG